jgi:hypothetical protein
MIVDERVVRRNIEKLFLFYIGAAFNKCSIVRIWHSGGLSQMDNFLTLIETMLFTKCERYFFYPTDSDCKKGEDIFE